MPTLYLLRHAKAAVAAGQKDRERPLAERGRRDAALMGRHMAAVGYLPEKALCSPARRTRETLAAVVAAFDPVPEAVLVEDLYYAGAENYLAALRSEGGEAASLIVVGHNPSIAVAARLLVGGGEGADLPEKYVTGALAVIDFAMPWAEVKPGSGRLAAFVSPADIGGGPDG